MMTLVLAFMGVARADVVTIGSGTETSTYVPSYSYYKQGFSQQLYTPAEIGSAGTIYSIAFYNDGATKTRTYDVYMVHTTKTAFTSNTDWITVTSADQVFTGSVTMTAGGWTTITLATPFEYDGTSNLAIVMDDNSGNYTPSPNMNCRVFEGTDNCALYTYDDYYDTQNFDPFAPSFNGARLNKKNQIQLDFTPTGGVTPVEYDDLLHVKYTDPVNGEIIDSLNLGTRPINAWMAPFEFVMFSEGPTYTVNVLDFTPSDGIFNMVDVEYPYQVAPSADVDLLMSTNGTQAGIIERQFVAITEGDRAAHIWPVVVEFYAPEVPDVVELPCEEATSFPFVEYPASAHNTVLHNDYTLPFPEIPEGYDAVYKLVFDNDMILNAEVTEGENGKVALYLQQGNELPHPMADNNYTGLGAGGNGGGAGASFEVQIGEGTNTTGYFPFYTLYNYSIAENLFLATELTEAGVTTAPMTSLSWYATNAPGYTQQGITIWMANVSDTELTTTSHVVTGMTKVYTGAMTPAVGWNEFVFNEGSFSWDGHSNVLIYCQRNNGAWNSTVSWQATSGMNFNCMSYRYQDSGAYDETVGNPMYTSTIRPNIIMKGGNREVNRDVILSEGFENGFSGWTMTNCHGSSGVTSSYYAHSGNASFRFYYTTNPPQYLITPMLTGTENGGEVSFWYTGYSTYYTESFQVGYSSTTNDVNAFTFGPEISCTVNGTWTEFTDSFPAGTKYIAVKHTANDQFYLFVDDFTVTATPGSTPTPDPTPTPGSDEALDISAGPVISNLPLTPGTYYLVASSTDEDFEVTINAEPMPCPAIDAEGFAFNPQPADDEDELEPASVTLRWMVPEYATGWRLVFGSTYYPDPNHDQTIIYPEDGGWSTTMANSYTVHNLWNNTNYFWHVEFNNGACPEGVSSPIWGFTTHLNVPQNLTVEDETVFNDEQIVLNWNPVVDRTYRYYFIYRDGVKIGETPVNNIGATTYTDGPLAYNMNGYNYYVTAIYDEGESAPSNTVNVKVSGYGDVNGHVYEQDGTTGIANATVTMVGEDEFGDPHTYNFTTDGNGYYSGHIYAGEYDGQAACNGYQPIDAPVQGNPIAINYNETTTPIDYILDENFYGPCAVVAEYYPDSLDPNSPYVKVYWGCGLHTGGIVEDFETGDFSKIDWQLDGSYPWTITTTSPYEGTYCMKSGGAGVANVVSNMTVTVNVPADGQMSFYGKISCENNWDYGYFYIDGVQRGSYSGTSSWGERVFDITEGEHTFRWSYTKDGSVNSNDDCFYVDYISFLRQPDAAAAGMNIDAENSNEQGFTTDDRALSHYRVYRTNCYNDGPYTEENTVLLATVWVPDTVYIDVEWADLAPGVYKWGVGAVYVGNRGEEVESPVAWTAPMDVNLDKANRQTITIGDGTSTTYYGPFNSLWGYSFVEQIYTAGEIGTAGPITAIGFNMQSTDPETNQVDIFMKNVSRSSFADNADWEPVSNTDKVFSGTVTFENGWTTITLDTPFQYDGTSNLMIGMHEYTPGYSTRYFYYTNASNALISAHSDTADPDPFNIGAFTGTKYVQSYRPNLQLEINGGGVIPGGDNPYGPGTDPIQEERESVIVWSNCLDKDMYMENVDVTVLLNSADSPEGTVVTLTNLNDVEQDLYPVDPVTLDGSGYYAWDTFRRGNYAVQVELDGYETIYDTVNIWEPAHLRYVMIEILYKVGNIYVSRTGWAMCDGIDVPGGGTNPTPSGDGDTFNENFDAGIPAGWTTVDADGDGYTWVSSMNPGNYHNSGVDLTGTGHNASTAYVISGSWANGTGTVLYPDNYLVSPQVTLASGSTFSFWACAQDANYPADHFGVFISDNGTSNWTMVQEWTMTAKGTGAMSYGRNGALRAQGNWYNYTVDLSAFAGQKYIAIRHFNCSDQFILNVDDIQLTSGAKSYNAMASGMLNNGSYAFNITDIANYDERVYFLYNLVNDNRFDVINGEANGMFIISATSASLDLEEAVNDFVYNNNIEFGLMDKVQAADVANAYKSSLPSGFVNSLMMDMYIQSRENNMCEFADPFCTDNGMYEFPAGVNAGSGETGPDYDCLYTQPNPAWYYMRIGDAGAMDIHMYSTPQVDIDFCCWGPFDDPTSPCPYGLTDDKVVSCSYSTSWTEHCMIPASAQTGEYYILVITNYSNQTCNINFSMVEGNGSTDCGILPPTDILGFLITQDGEYLAFAGPTEREYTDIDEFGDHIYCVRPIYPGEMTLPDHNYGWSMGCPVCADNNGEITCEPGWPIHAEEIGATDQVKIWWGEENPGPGPGGDADTFTVNFDGGMPAGWTTIDADNDGYTWILGSACDGIYLSGGNLSGAGHNSSADLIVSGSYSNVVGALMPDNYLVTPQVNLAAGSTFSFWACGQDANYVAEHFGVFVSDNGTSDWTMVQEWTMTAKGGGVMSYGRDGNTRAQGSWHQYTVDLSAFAGQKYIAIRHFNCTDQFILDVDDIELSAGGKSNRAAIDYFNVYRSTDNANYSVIGTVAYDADATYYEYIDTPEAAGTYYYQVKAVYDNGCVSEAAAAFDNPAQNYVQAEVTGMGENNDNVALYPNPTNGNVTIEANGMSRITVVSVLGQVLYDAEVNADNVTLNMAQFNAGMYMVRVYTEEGVVVKRVTVMQ